MEIKALSDVLFEAEALRCKALVTSPKGRADPPGLEPQDGATLFHSHRPSLRSPGDRPPMSLPPTEEASEPLLADVIDCIPLAVAIVDIRGQIATTNEPAGRLLARGDGLRTSGGALEAHLPSETQRLRAMIRDILLRPPISRPTRGILAVSRPSGRQPFIVVVRPLRECNASFVSACGRALITINDLEWSLPDCAHLLRHTFDLTIAEAEVATSLMDGYEPRQIAHRRAVRVSTIRTQIRNILAKTRVTRQVDLVKLIARLPRIDPI